MIMNENKISVSAKGLRLMLAGVLVMVAGLLLLSGGGMKDPQVFNYDMFDFRRLVAAPIVILAGIVVIAVSILGEFKETKKKK
ncbi:uncharacterized protein BN459_01306 [Bacteroides sp. CAG:1060]|nr:uncharacterized protein BN459_01306 [Bacteroides sp. CAG:1060]